MKKIFYRAFVVEYLKDGVFRLGTMDKDGVRVDWIEGLTLHQIHDFLDQESSGLISARKGRVKIVYEEV